MTELIGDNSSKIKIISKIVVWCVSNSGCVGGEPYEGVRWGGKTATSPPTPSHASKPVRVRRIVDRGKCGRDYRATKSELFGEPRFSC